MIGAMQQQLDFIAYIQRMLVEGEFSATYKIALVTCNCRYVRRAYTQ